MIIFTKIIPNSEKINLSFSLWLTAEQRNRSRQQIFVDNKETIYLQLKRGIILKDGDLLTTENNQLYAVIKAKLEPVITVRAKNSLDLCKAAYHLGNRHISLEINKDYLRLSPDAVLKSMLINLDLEITEEICPFYPELGAYAHHH